MKRKKNRWVSTPDGITFGAEGEELTFVPWSDVSRVVGFKTDGFTIDFVWLEVATSHGAFRMHEDVPSFGEFRRHVEQAFGIDPKWHMEVALPPFERSFTVLYEQPREAPSEC